MGWQAKAPAPQRCKPLRTNVGQALSPVNTAIPANISRLLSEWVCFGTESRGRRPTKLPGLLLLLRHYLLGRSRAAGGGLQILYLRLLHLHGEHERVLGERLRHPVPLN